MNKLSLGEQIEIPVNSVYSPFITHLENNERIVFSAPFGTGKTYFLRKYFEEEMAMEKYNVFHLFPVNYQVASNEDIFEYIKYDILLHLVDKQKINEEDKTAIGESLAFQAYLDNNTLRTFSRVIKTLPFPVAKLAAEIGTILTEFRDYQKKINETDFDLARSFAMNLENVKGSLYEFDPISQIINNKITEETERKSVLILDDLDRIDPEHIFRILNVFSAHFDMPGEEVNKFGFDKVIFVCDINNIRNIFHAKYGDRTDFKGYIDKFYSSFVFTFDNSGEIVRQIRVIVSSVLRKLVGGNNSIPGIDIEWMIEIIEIFVDNRVISLRELFNVNNLQNGNFKSLFYRSLKRVANECQSFEFIIFIKCLLLILGGDVEKLKRLFRQLENSNIVNHHTTIWIQFAIAVLYIDEIARSWNNTNHDLERVVFVHLSNKEIQYTMVQLNYSFRPKFTSIKNKEGQDVDLDFRDFCSLANEAIDAMKRHGYI